MRSTLMLLVLVCGPAFSRQNANPTPATEAPAFSGGVPQKLSDALRMKFGYYFNPQAAETPKILAASPILRLMAAKPASAACSIPLVNVKPPGTPVAMPNMMPETAVPGNALAPTGPIDNMQVVAPAPACPADFGKVSVSHTAP
jgi:hypothetical protein